MYAQQQQGQQPGQPPLSHPPGYVQNPSVNQPGVYGGYNYSAGGALPPQQQQGGGGGGTGPMFSDGNDDEGIWGTAMSWAKYAGEKVVEAEAEVWRRVNGK